jgi:hypothetical protein
VLFVESEFAREGEEEVVSDGNKQGGEESLLEMLEPGVQGWFRQHAELDHFLVSVASVLLCLHTMYESRNE